VWVVRFQARTAGRRLRTIYIGGEPCLLRRARRALADLQAPRDRRREIAAAAGWLAAAAVLARRLVREFPRFLGRPTGG
jgi:hypothetical protein